MDFGLAKAPAVPSASLSGIYMGSPHYMAPEQVKDATRASARSDIYSFAAVLYEMVTGRKVFPGDSSFEVMQAQVDSAPVPPIEIDSTIPPALNDAILTALEKDPERRFSSADAFREALEHAVRQDQPATASPLLQAKSRWRVPMMQFVATCAVLLPVAYYTGVRRPQPESPSTPVIEIRMPSPARVEEPVVPEQPEPPPEPRPRRRARVARAPRSDATRIVPGDEPPLRVRQAQTPVEHVPELAPPPPISLAAAPSPELEPPAVEPPQEKKPNRVRRALSKILSPFQKRSAETPQSRLRPAPESDR
jgi:serine/threonine-protein kinase